MSLLIIVDCFTKLVRAVPTKRTNMFQISKAVTTKYAFLHGVLKTVPTDNEPQSCGKRIECTGSSRSSQKLTI